MVADAAEVIAQKRFRPRKARQMLQELFRQTYGEVLPAATIGQYVMDWLSARKHEVAPASFSGYAKALAKLVAFLGSDRDLADIQAREIASFRDFLVAQVSATTTNFDLRAVKMLLKSARRDGYVSEDPSEFVNAVKAEKDSGRQAFDINEIRAILAVADPEWQSLIKFGLYTGQRLGDLSSLSWDNLDLESGQIRLITRKTGKQMLIPIAGPLANHIAALSGSDDPKAPIHPRSFATLQSQNGRSGTLSNQFAALLVLANLRVPAKSCQPPGLPANTNGRGGRRSRYELSFHSLRHTAVSLLKDAGVPESVVMELVGHDSKMMSDHYTHTGMEALTKAAAALPEL